MKKIIINLFDCIGIELKRKAKTDLSFYQNFPQQSLKERLFFNIGAGSFEHPMWTNIDYATEHYKNVQKSPFIHYDLMAKKPLPIENNTAEIVYSSHTIEHVTDEAVRNMLLESYRILKKGGGIRLTAPDANLAYGAYVRQDIKYWYWVDWYSKKNSWERLYTIPLCKASIHQLFIHGFASQLCEIDIDDSPTKKFSDIEIYEKFISSPNVKTLSYFTSLCKFNADHPGNHINWWTHDKLIFFMKEAGFNNPYISGYGQSAFSPLRDTNYFDNTHPKISLYVEGVK